MLHIPSPVQAISFEIDPTHTVLKASDEYLQTFSLRKQELAHLRVHSVQLTAEFMALKDLRNLMVAS